MIMKIKTVKIEWSYPRAYENIFNSPKINGVGIYCLSRKYGDKETLLYIGKSNHSFKSRLNSHQEWFEQYKGKRLVRLGIIAWPEKLDDKLTSFVESALILATEPYENTQSRKSYTYFDDCEYEIINTGYRGLLPKIIKTAD